MDPQLVQSLVIALVVGGASAVVGAFVVLRRMALVGDALSHVALPGIALALVYEIDPFWGVLLALVAAAVVIFWLEKKTALSSEALVGILFTASLAVGILTIPDTEILESLFGEFPLLTSTVLFAVAFVAIAVTGLTLFFSRKFAFRIISSELAEVGTISSIYNLLFLVLFSIAVALGIKLVGTLLMGALTIIPASTAKNITKSMKSYIVLSLILGTVTSLLGVIAAYSFNLLPGPTIVLLGIAFFILSLFVRAMRR